MKKVLSMILVLAMMLSLVTVASVTSTAEEVKQGVLEEATGAKDPGVIKTGDAVLSAETLATQLAAGGTYHMTGNIDAGTTALTVATGTTIYGNGYTLKLGASLTVAANATVKFENIVFNTTCAIIGTIEGCDISFTDCTRTGNINPTFGRYGGYILALGAAGSTNSSKVTFTNCINSGDVKTTTDQFLMGGFIGGVRAVGSEVTFDRCTNAGEIYSPKQQVGGFIAALECKATVGFNNCINDALINGQKWVGGFIGYSNTADGPTLNFTNCENRAEVQTFAYQFAGGFLGDALSGSATFKNCTNSGGIKSQQTSAGGFIGHASNTEFSFENCANSGGIKSQQTYAGGFIGLASNAPLSFENCANSGGITSVTTDAGGFIGYALNAPLSFENCANSGDIEGTGGNSGGLVGEFLGTQGGDGTTASFKNCTNSGGIKCSSSASNAAGFIGKPHTNSTADALIQLSFTNCVNSGTIEGGKENSGGFVGDFMVKDGVTGTTATFTNCTNSGDVSVVNNYAGGFAAKAAFTTEVTFVNCHNAGDVKATAAEGSSAGGFIGRPITEANFTNCKNSGAVSAKTRFGSFAGFVHARSVINLTNCINTGYIAEGDTYNGTRAAGDWVGAGAPAANLTNCANTQDDVTPTVAPVLVGSQETTAVDGKQKIRFAAAIDSINYDKVGFIVTATVTTSAGTVTVIEGQKYESSTVFLSLKAGDNYETPVSVKEKNLVGDMTPKYLYTLTFEDVPASADATVVFTVQTYGVIGDETKTSGTYEITYVNGAVVQPAAN